MPGQFEIDNVIPLEEGIAQYEIQDAVVGELQRRGINPPHAPATIVRGGGSQPYRGEIPSDITRLTDDELGTLMGLLSQWMEYINYQLAQDDMNRIKAQKELELTEARIRITPHVKYDESGKKRVQQERDDIVKTDRRFVSAQSRVLYFDAVYTITQAVAKGAEKSFAAVSRRITQRGQEVERIKRDQGVQSIPQPYFRGRG